MREETKEPRVRREVISCWTVLYMDILTLVLDHGLEVVTDVNCVSPLG